MINTPYPTEVDTPYPEEVDTPYLTVDQNSLEVGWIRRIHVLDTAYWGFLGARIRRIFLNGYGVLVFRTTKTCREENGRCPDRDDRHSGMDLIDKQMLKKADHKEFEKISICAVGNWRWTTD
ncbi:hypothetical protein Tco_0551669 [Tanacetum coccineum]